MTDFSIYNGLDYFLLCAYLPEVQSQNINLTEYDLIRKRFFYA